jgi:hypothetical protein
MNHPSRLLAAALVLFAVPAHAQDKPYKGAEIYSQQSVLHGKAEMRMRMARGSGILSTFFLYKDGSEQAGQFWEEIDIEVFGKDDAMIWQSNIISGNPRTLSEQEHEHSSSLADAYHDYAVEWGPGYVRWLFDGQEVRLTEGGQADDLTNPQSLRFNIWSALAEGWVGPFDDSVLPQHQFVNWIKYYRYEGGEFVLDWTDEFETFDETRWGKANWTFAENRVDFAPENVVVQDGVLVLSLTKAGETGFTGTVPQDDGVGTEPGAAGGGDGDGGDGDSGGTDGNPDGDGGGGDESDGAGLPMRESEGGCSVALAGGGVPSGYWLCLVAAAVIRRRGSAPSRR